MNRSRYNNKIALMKNFVYEMLGKYNGVIWNDSDWPVEYAIYPKDEEFANQSPNHQHDHDLQAELKDSGIKNSKFKHQDKHEPLKKYNDQFVMVLPGLLSIKNLEHLQLGEYRISVRLRIGDFVKYLIKDIVVYAQSDIALKVRFDLSIKNLAKQEATEYIQKCIAHEAKIATKEDNQRREKKYEDVLHQLNKAYELAQEKLQK